MITRFILLLFIPSLAIPQVDSLKESLEYYPLQTGDYWQYHVEYYHNWSPDTSYGYYVYRSVLKDTVLSNGLEYKVVRNHRMFRDMVVVPARILSDTVFDEFLRLDSSTATLYAYADSFDYKVDSLLMQSGNFVLYSGPYWVALVYCFPADSVFLFGSEHPAGMREAADGIENPDVEDYRYLSGIGRSYRSFLAGNFSYSITDSLVYAKVNGVEYGKLVDVKRDGNIVSNFSMEQNYPNPFNPTTVITYDIPKPSHVSLIIYDILGRQIETLVNGEKQPGHYQLTFDGSRLPSGVYFCWIHAGNYTATKKLLLLK